MATRIDKAVKNKGIGMLMQGHSETKVAASLGIARTTVQRWKKSIPKMLMQGPDMEGLDYAEQVGKNLFEMILAMQQAVLRQLEVMGDPTWLRKQSAGELAALHGVIHDKIVRLCEVAATAEEQINAAG